MRILLARLCARLRAAERSETAVIPLGEYEFRPAENLVAEQGTNCRIRLTAKETALLKFLCRTSEPTPRHVLLQEVWHYVSEADSHPLETHVYRLRQKLAGLTSTPDLVETLPAVYRLRVHEMAPS